MIFIYLLIVLLKIKYYHCYYTTDWRHDYHYRQTPQDLMVDIINRFGFKLLAIHNENNNNNIAFSPYGAVSVLVALCEGVQGDGRNEIQYAINLPNDISITRIGLRDIHRHLKSYFIPDEGFLAGLILSHNNIELNREYVDILRFYGFDIESLNSSGLYPDFATTVTTTEIPTTTTMKEETEATTTKTTINEETEGTTITTTIKEETVTITTPITSTEIVETTTPLITTPEMSEITTTPLTTTTSETSSTITENVAETTTETPTATTTTTEITENVAETTETTAAATTETVNRRKRSVVDYLIARYYDEHTITQKPSSSMIINGKFDDESNINFMIYDTILPFFYFAHLETLALRFPLDNTRYYLLLLLPSSSSSSSNINGIDRLICDLQQTNLHYIIKNLKYTRVRAVIPSFMLKGFVVLTTTFQKLGIRKVFEPRHADFSPMTNDRDIYVTNIEQIITITIRNYLDGSKNRSDNYHLRYFHHQEPILFKVDRPFLYFVVDADLHVTLMAGKIINPLNSRIK